MTQKRLSKKSVVRHISCCRSFFKYLLNERIAARAFDNRIGAFIVLEALKKAKENDVYVVLDEAYGDFVARGESAIRFISVSNTPTSTFIDCISSSDSTPSFPAFTTSSLIRCKISVVCCNAPSAVWINEIPSCALLSA